jgi:copper chaperone NosL
MARAFQPNRRFVLAGLSAFTCVGLPRGAGAVAVDLPAPGPRDACPVCGMFVAPYRYWISTIAFNDGATVHFDGAKDLFKYLTDMPKWAGGRTRGEIRAIGVTSYYDATLISATDAFYVMGSDVLGPMGHELVPLDTEADAQEFMRDHKGRRIIRAADITPAVLTALDDGRFE